LRAGPLLLRAAAGGAELKRVDQPNKPLIRLTATQRGLLNGTRHQERCRGA
jgi:hypothetical protein